MASKSGRGAVLVTGASKGLGLEIALNLAEQGFVVWAGARDPQAPEIAQAAAARNVKLKTVALDVTSDESVQAAMQRIGAEEESLYGLINNAGITNRCCFEEFPDARVREIFEVNTFGPMRVTRHALPLMRRGKSGRIIMVSSVGGRIGAVSVAPYVSSKFALEGFAESLALELKFFNIDVTIVEPGMVKTSIWGDARILPEARNPNSPYYKVFWAAEELANAALNSAKLQPTDVAQVVSKVMNSSSPRLREVVGKRAGLIIRLRSLFANGLFERLYFGAQVQMIRRRMEKIAAAR